MWAILLCSIVALAIILERFLALYHAEIDTTHFLAEITRAVKTRKFTHAEQLCDQNPSPIARVTKTGMRMYGQGRADILESMQEVVSSEIPPLQQHTPLLGSIAHTSLLLGLLGTVTGLIRYFQIIQLKATTLNPVAPGDLAGGIWEALLNTAFGLLVAIPTYAMYNYLAHRTNAQANQLDATATYLARLLAEEHSESPNPVHAHAI